MTKKIFLLALAVLTVSILAAGTAAYHSVRGEADNVVTTAGISVALQEWADQARTQPYEVAHPGNKVEGVVPGQTVTKIVEVQNTGLSPAYVRVKVEKAVTLRDGTEGDAAPLRLDFNDSDWQAQGEGDGLYYYYTKSLEPAATTTPLFTQVAFDPGMDNTYRGSAASVDVTAYATQTAHNDQAGALGAQGWPQE